MRVEELMAEAGLSGGIREDWLSADCPGCGQEVAPTSMTVQVEGDESIYICECGAFPVAIDSMAMAKEHASIGLKGASDRLHWLTAAKALYITHPNGNKAKLPGGPRAG